MLSVLASRLRNTATPMVVRSLSSKGIGLDDFGLGKTPYSAEMPLQSLANRMADAVAPEEALMALGKRAPEVSGPTGCPHLSPPLPPRPAPALTRGAQALTARAERELYVPNLPVFCPLAAT